MTEGDCDNLVWLALRLLRALDQINGKLDKIMTAQDDVNAAVAAIQAFLADLGAAVTNIQAELANVAPAVDTTALNALVAQLPAVQASVDALESPVTPPPAGP